MISYTGTTIGAIVIRQKSTQDGVEHKFNLQIRQGNCLATIIHVAKITDGENVGKYQHTLYTFFADEQHLKNIIKSYGKIIGDEVVSVRLNMFYKENYTLLKYFVQSGYRVTCYYKESK